MSDHETARRYAVPETHPEPEPQPGDIAVWVTADVPPDVRAKWEGKPKEKPQG